MKAAGAAPTAASAASAPQAERLREFWGCLVFGFGVLRLGFWVAGLRAFKGFGL